MENLNKLLKFIEFYHKFQQVKRRLLATGEDRYENDAEHSYQLALVSWYLISSNKLKLNVDLVLKYAILHDLVETYAGDTFIYGEASRINDKKEREEEALKKIKEEFGEVSEFWEIVEKYESKSDEESKFVYIVDKLLPPINIYLNGGKTWREENITLEMIKENKTPKMMKSKEIYPYWVEFVKLLEANQEKLFKI